MRSSLGSGAGVRGSEGTGSGDIRGKRDRGEKKL